MVCSRGESLTQHTNQMISNKQMSVASATVDALRAKGEDAFTSFMAKNIEKISNLRDKLSSDTSNFSAFRRAEREQMLLEYAIGLEYFSSLTEQEQLGVTTIARRQYDHNNQVMVSWLLGGFVCIALLVALFTGNNGSKEDSNRSQLNSVVIAEMIA